jgi:hypothetical protein
MGIVRYPQIQNNFCTVAAVIPSAALYRVIKKSLCTSRLHHYHNTRLSYFTTCLNLTAWQPTARARGNLTLTNAICYH